MKVKTIKRKQYSLICNDCDREIKGTSIESAEYNMRIHKDKHAREIK